LKDEKENITDNLKTPDNNFLSGTVVSYVPFYDDGQIKIYNEDCLEVMQAFRPNSFDMVLTDPPYTSPTKHAFGRKVIKRLSDLSIQEFYFNAIKNAWEILLKDNSPALVFCDNIYNAVLTGLFYEWQQIDTVIWDKGNIGMGNPFRKQHEFIFYANRGSIELNKENITHLSSIMKAKSKKQFHGAEKPLSILEQLIDGLTRAGDIILDPFMGSGSTLIAAKKLGRKAVGIEMDNSYCEIAVNRLTKTDLFN